MLEVYNETLVDLLADPGSTKTPHVLSQAEGGRNVADLVERPVSSEDDVVRVMKMGDANRSVAATKMNSSSSRSHLAVIVYVSSVNRLSKVEFKRPRSHSFSRIPRFCILPAFFLAHPLALR